MKSFVRYILSLTLLLAGLSSLFGAQLPDASSIFSLTNEAILTQTHTSELNATTCIVTKNQNSGLPDNGELNATEETEVEESELETSKKYMESSLFFQATLVSIFLGTLLRYKRNGFAPTKPISPFRSLGALFIAYEVYRL